MMAREIENAAVVRKGDLKWLDTLHTVLSDAGIPSTVVFDADCRKGCCRDTCRLVVSKDDVERAQERITEYYMEIHPELRASTELLNQGKCPACGSPVGAGDNECSDCGLMLVITEENQDGEGD